MKIKTDKSHKSHGRMGDNISSVKILHLQLHLETQQSAYLCLHGPSKIFTLPLHNLFVSPLLFCHDCLKKIMKEVR